ncbi:MAG: imidazole glycerol phosphate synthase subunit HisH [Clostridium sp.]
MIAIIDYGMGNLKSVKNALDFIGLESEITSDHNKILEANGVVLPGVGAFKDAMKNLKKNSLDKIIIDVAKAGTPLLGICLGMQLLYEKGFEGEECEGLALLKGDVIKMKGTDIRIPHIGWNLLMGVGNKLTYGINESLYVYFVHSYIASNYKNEELINYAEYGDYKIPALVGRDNILGAQFHPEKSGDVGLEILKRFGEMVK